MNLCTMPATRAHALERLATFLPSAGRDYAARRNLDLGPASRSNVSVLSPFVRHRLLHEAEVIDAVTRRHKAYACEKFVQEVCWRTYWKGWLEHHPSAWVRYLETRTRAFAQLERDRELAERYRRAVDGASGIGCFDAWAHELVATGFLHNHTRMWVASIWTFTLGLPWELGADWFYRHLLDGDPASNTLSWRWVAGLHTRGKHYLARATNIAKYTEGRFDPHGQLDERARPIAADAPIASEPLRAGDCLDAARSTGLLISEEDAHPESLGLCIPVRAIASVAFTDARSPLPVGRPAQDFAHGALADARVRAAVEFGCPVTEIDAHRLAPTRAAVLDWAASHRLEQVVSAFACIGPVRTLFDALRPALAAQGIAFVELQRAWDRSAWPHAARGFSGLRAHIPALTRDAATLVAAA